jgi:hypothetical protein
MTDAKQLPGDELADLDERAGTADAPPTKRRPGKARTPTVRTRAIVCDGWSLRRDGRSYVAGSEVALEFEDAESLRAEGAIRDPEDVDPAV